MYEFTIVNKQISKCLLLNTKLLVTYLYTLNFCFTFVNVIKNAYFGANRLSASL